MTPGARSFPLDRARGGDAGECPREADVLEAVAFGRWPSQCAELAAHASTCAVCRDVADVAHALSGDLQSLCRESQPPPAGMVWWRATIRARADAARTVTKPISAAQGVAAACIAGAAVGLGGAAWRSMHWLDRLGDLAAHLEARQASIAAASTFAAQHGMPILLALAAGLVLAPLALYLTLADD